MRFDDDNRFSDNIGSQRGMSFGGGGGGGFLGLLLPLVASRFGIVGILILLLGYCALSTFGGGGTGGQQAVAPGQTAATGQSAAEICQSDASTRFACLAYTSTEEVWSQLFRTSGAAFDPPRLVFYDRAGQSGCGAASAAMGPFYCPPDHGIYLDTSFFRELSQQYGAPGDFAQAYVIAHEMGHHIQTITGISDRVRQQQARASRAEGNALQVRMELQADCYAGVWAANARLSGESLEPGDVEEGLRAASAIGDDTLQKAAQGYAVPESFTHGTAAQRQQWLRRGLESGDPNACDTFSGAI